MIKTWSGSEEGDVEARVVGRIEGVSVNKEAGFEVCMLDAITFSPKPKSACVITVPATVEEEEDEENDVRCCDRVFRFLADFRFLRRIGFRRIVEEEGLFVLVCVSSEGIVITEGEPVGRLVMDCGAEGNREISSTISDSLSLSSSSSSSSSATLLLSSSSSSSMIVVCGGGWISGSTEEASKVIEEEEDDAAAAVNTGTVVTSLDSPVGITVPDSFVSSSDSIF